MPSKCLHVHACACQFVTINTNLDVSSVYEDILTKFTENVHSYENMFVKIASFTKKMWMPWPIFRKRLRCYKTLDIAAVFIRFKQNENMAREACLGVILAWSPLQVRGKTKKVK